MKLSRLDLCFLAGLSMLSFIATDLYLPAFAQMEVMFNTGAREIALSLSFFLAGMACSQIIWGILADRYGQRQSLMLGLTIYLLATFGLCMATEVWQLLSLRFVQAIGVCSAAVIWQAMVIQRYDASTAEKAFATLMPLLALSPALAPQLGVLLLEGFGVRSLFIALLVIGAALLLLTMSQPEDAPKDDEKKPFSLSEVSRDLITILMTPRFLGNALIYSFCSALFFAYLTGIPKIMTDMGYTSRDIGLSFVPQTIAFILGGQLSKYGVSKLGARTTLNGLLLISIFSASSLAFIAQMPLQSITLYLGMFMVCSIASGGIYPIVINMALSAAKSRAATAAGVQNTLQIGFSFAASSLVAANATNALPVSGFVIGLSVLGIILGYIIANPGVLNLLRFPDIARINHSGDKSDS